MTTGSAAAPASRPMREPGVIWVTGYSAAGKTTVGRLVVGKLRDAGTSTVFLDGDELRAILGHKWGYERADRVELAGVYFRLCAHLAAQGVTVVISCIAMYDETRAWVKEHLPSIIEAYLHVPEAERRRRDEATKKVYRNMGNLADLYDEPTAPDMRIDNFGGVSPDEVAQQIVDQYFASARAGAGQEG